MDLKNVLSERSQTVGYVHYDVIHIKLEEAKLIYTDRLVGV